MVSLLCEGLVDRGIDVTLFATGDSITRARLEWVCPRPYEEDAAIDPKVWECLHIAHLFERAAEFDLIHNHYDFLPLTYSRLAATPMVTTIHGFSSPKILPVYQRYADTNYYVAISDADRHPSLNYLATVYHGVDLESFPFVGTTGSYLLYFGRIHPDKGTTEAIAIARRFGMPLVIAGIVQDGRYFREEVAPRLEHGRVEYIGPVGPERRGGLLGNAYALLHPVNFEEPFGLSVVEAMACGTPVVAFNRGSMPEVVLHGETGFLVGSVVEAVDALGRVPTLARQDCRRWVEQRFSRERMVRDYLAVYEQVLKCSSGRDVESMELSPR
jgi:glycosyltransferase involved in cell wall biosynthesis